MTAIQVHLDLNLGPRGVRGLLVAGLLLALAPELASESTTLTTYYPAPSGVYTQMITTGNTFLARDGGNVGVGTASPRAKLEVDGKVLIQDGSQGADNVLTSDANGLASWAPAPKAFNGGYCVIQEGNSVVGSNNPLTGKRTCPTGTTAKLFFATGGIGSCSGQCVIWSCYICY